MKRILVLAALFAWTLQAQPEAGAGIIEGRITDLLTGAPIRRASVFLTAPQTRMVASTNAEGRFEFTGLPPGTYRVSATRTGYLERRARRVALPPNGRITGVEIRLPRQGAISGRVLDEDGEAVDHARLLLYKQVYRDGKKLWERVNIVTETSDSGEYRFIGLEPGHYLVNAYDLTPPVENRYGDSTGALSVPTYYPNAISQQQAVPLEVGLGDSIGGIDIQVRKLARRTPVRIRGTVSGMSAEASTVVAVTLMRSDGGFLGSGAGTTANAPDYTFSLTAPPGDYTLSGNVYSGGPEAWGSIALTVTTDIAGIVLPMQRAPELAGRIRLAEDKVPLQFNRVAVVLKNTSDLASGSLELRADATGRFVSRPLRPGHYAIEKIKSLPPELFVREIRLNGRQIAPDGFQIDSPAQLEIVVSGTAAGISASVTDAEGHALADAAVILLSPDGKMRPVKEVVNDDGNASFTSLPPGKYKLFAAEEVDDDLWQDPAFHKKYESRATDITIGPGETGRVQLHPVTAEQMR